MIEIHTQLMKRSIFFLKIFSKEQKIPTHVLPSRFHFQKWPCVVSRSRFAQNISHWFYILSTISFLLWLFWCHHKQHQMLCSSSMDQLNMKHILRILANSVLFLHPTKHKFKNTKIHIHPKLFSWLIQEGIVWMN